LIAARTVQAAGASMMMAIGPALITSAFPSQERGKSLGLAGSSVALGLLAGPLVGGVILQHLSWHWLFFVNLPVGLALLIAAEKANVPDPRGRTRIDLFGAALLAASIGFLLFALDRGQSHGWVSAATLSYFALAAALACAFVIIERSTDDPLIRLGLFKHRDFALGALTGWINYAATSPVPVFIPFYLQHVLGCSAQKTGLILTSGPLTLALTAPLAGAVSDRIGSRPLTTAGLAAAGVGLMFLANLSPNTSLATVVFRLALTSFGSALFVSPNSSAVMGSVPKDELGVAAGVVALVRNLGMVCGVAAAGSIITTIRNQYTATGEIGHGAAFQNLAFLAGLRAAFTACACLAFAGAVISSFRTTPKAAASVGIPEQPSSKCTH
ncbi:MAG: MFS transporter, partial [Armatimonadota bacterium]|nr:MFS transporter [Armatimonadota bacterium]